MEVNLKNSGCVIRACYRTLRKSNIQSFVCLLKSKEFAKQSNGVSICDFTLIFEKCYFQLIKFRESEKNCHTLWYSASTWFSIFRSKRDVKLTFQMISVDRVILKK